MDSHSMHEKSKAATLPPPVIKKGTSSGLADRRAQTLPDLSQFPPSTQMANAFSVPLSTGTPNSGTAVHDSDQESVSGAAPVSDSQAVVSVVKVDSDSSSELRARLPLSSYPDGKEASSASSPKPAPKPPRGHVWLKHQWGKMMLLVERHWIIFCILFLSTVVSISIAMGWALRLHTFNAVQVLDEEVATPSVVLSANLVDVDSNGQTMTIDWFVLYSCDPNNCQDVNLFFDANLLRSQSDSGATANNLKPPPIFFINGTNYLDALKGDYRSSSPVFRTDVAITSSDTGRTEQSYPFDEYTATLVFFAQTLDNNGTVPVAINYTEGIAVGFNTELQIATSGNGTDGTLVKNLVVTRGAVVRMYAILIVLAIWLVTLTFIMACVTSVFFGKGIRADILVLPVATLFAFTQLRGTLPGAPEGFGRQNFPSSLDNIHTSFFVQQELTLVGWLAYRVHTD
ncbi:hypothetical protein AcW1_009145 [Taiwanofungus camphoratus]|nr:hypothetical protein AcV5_007168 [Antrodia cinnamomea]KAI0949584.1 hypothetical protein AcW1_009145 [Antrodia cinnamomea]KAI0958595.1 hypothetical protein AcV7_004377 [Antrodia cinnamomea]